MVCFTEIAGETAFNAYNETTQQCTRHYITRSSRFPYFGHIGVCTALVCDGGGRRATCTSLAAALALLPFASTTHDCEARAAAFPHTIIRPGNELRQHRQCAHCEQTALNAKRRSVVRQGVMTGCGEVLGWLVGL